MDLGNIYKQEDVGKIVWDYYWRKSTLKTRVSHCARERDSTSGSSMGNALPRVIKRRGLGSP